tara:strand:+ start:3513 stop:4721 length:1209 start_codon:yes stop_codon:yes gene_type:complete
MARYIDAVPQYLDAAGDPLALGKLYFFVSGTNTPLATYKDVNETIANMHPVELTGDGRVPNVFFSGSAKVVLTDADDVQYWSKDPVTAGGDSGTVGSDWDAISIYQVNSVVDFGGELYVSIINNNQNNNPSTAPTAWTRWDLLKRWNTNESYGLGDPVIASNGFLYTSLIDPNLGDDPTLNSGDWTLSESSRRSTNYLINPNFAINQRAFGGGQPAIGVYGFDRWKGDAAGLQIEQVVENAITINESFVISWVGGTGTATVDGTAGLASGDTFTLSTSANFSVIVPTDATFIQLEAGVAQTDFEYRTIGEELILCQRYYSKGDTTQDALVRVNSVTVLSRRVFISFPQTMRISPLFAFTEGGSWNATPTISDQGIDGATLGGDAASAGAATNITSWTADAEL